METTETGTTSKVTWKIGNALRTCPLHEKRTWGNKPHSNHPELKKQIKFQWLIGKRRLLENKNKYMKRDIIADTGRNNEVTLTRIRPRWKSNNYGFLRFNRYDITETVHHRIWNHSWNWGLVFWNAVPCSLFITKNRALHIRHCGYSNPTYSWKC